MHTSKAKTVLVLFKAWQPAKSVWRVTDTIKLWERNREMDIKKEKLSMVCKLWFAYHLMWWVALQMSTKYLHWQMSIQRFTTQYGLHLFVDKMKKNKQEYRLSRSCWISAISIPRFTHSNSQFESSTNRQQPNLMNVFGYLSPCQGVQGLQKYLQEQTLVSLAVAQTQGKSNTPRPPFVSLLLL